MERGPTAPVLPLATLEREAYDPDRAKPPADILDQFLETPSSKAFNDLREIMP
jgi:hypothetical protein